MTLPMSHAPALEGRTLLDELNHRIKNELASVINLVTFKAVWAENVEVKGARLENGLLHVELERVVPEEQKPRRIPINGANVNVIDGQAKAA